MLTYIHFVYLFVAFVVSIFLGGLLRVFYYSHEKKHFLKRLINVVFLQIYFPILAYKSIKKHKTEFLRDINKNNELTTKQKKKLRKNLNSNKRIALRFLWISIIRFKDILDLNVELLNAIRKSRNKEVSLIRIEIIKKDINGASNQKYRENILELYA